MGRSPVENRDRGPQLACPEIFFLLSQKLLTWFYFYGKIFLNKLVDMQNHHPADERQLGRDVKNE